MVQTLTDRQEQCLLLSVAMTDKQIARELGISPHTVNMHIRNAMDKLGVSSRKAAIASITRNPLYDYEAMVPKAEPAVDPVVSSPLDESGKRPEDEVRQPGNWTVAPSWFSPPPKTLGARTGLIILASFLTLIFGASLLGLLGFVFEVANRWAVDPII